MTRDEMLDACMKDIVDNGWENFSFSLIAQKTGIPVAEFYNAFPSPSDIPRDVVRKIDHDMLVALEEETFEDSSTREILFEIIMTRLEVSEHYKAFINVLWREWPADMFSAFLIASQGVGSMGWILDRAGLKNAGFSGLVRLHGLTILYLLTVKNWLEDDSKDLSKTMSFLDQGLARVERIAIALNL